MEIYRAKSTGNHITGHFREDNITKWQRRLNNEDKGRWTARFIPDIRLWIVRKIGVVNYYVMLPGHEYFRKYLHRIGKKPPPHYLQRREGN